MPLGLSNLGLDLSQRGGGKSPAEIVAEENGGNLYRAPSLADNAPISTFSPIVGTIAWTQGAAAAQPTFDAATDLFDFDGTSDYLIADQTGIANRSNMYVAFLIKTGTIVTTKYLLGNGSGAFRGLRIGGSSATATTGLVGGSIFVDTAGVADNRATLATDVDDDALHLLEFVGTDFSTASFGTDFNNLFLAASVGPASWFPGLILPLYLGPDPGAPNRAILQTQWASEFPALSY